MTIAAGFLCTDGLLLASDSLFTGVTKRFGRKLWSATRNDGSVVAVGGSGSETALLRIKDEVLGEIRGSNNERSILEYADRILQYVIETEGKGGATDKPEVLLGVRTGRGYTRLYFSVSGGVFAPLPDEAPVRCIGWATGLGQYVADRLCTPDGLSLKWAKVVAAHLIKQAKTYSGYCDGDTDLLEVPNVGEPRYTDDQEAIGRLESYLAEVDDAVRLVLPDGRANDDTLEHRLETLNETMRRVRHSLVITTAPAYFRRSVTTAPAVASVPPTASPEAPQAPQDSTRDPKPAPPSPESPGGSGES